MMSLHHFFLLAPYLESIASYSDCESPTQVAPSSSHMEIRPRISTIELSIHFRIHCNLLLSLWGPQGPCPTRPLWAAVTLHAHTLSQVSSSTPETPKTKRMLGGESALFAATELWNDLPCTLYSPLHCLFSNYIQNPPLYNTRTFLSAPSSSQQFQLQSNLIFVICDATKMCHALNVL